MNSYKWAWAAVLLIQALDVITTYIGIEWMGFVEGNLVALLFMEAMGFGGLIVMKALALLLVYCLLARFWPLSQESMVYPLMFFWAVSTIPVLTNTYMIYVHL